MIIEIRRDGDCFIIGIGDFLKSKSGKITCSDNDPYYYLYSSSEKIKDHFDEETAKLILNLKSGESIELASKNFNKIKDGEKYANLDEDI